MCEMWRKNGKLGVRDLCGEKREQGLPEWWIMSESNTGLQRNMGELAEEIVSKGMEPKQDTLQWTSKHGKEMNGPMVAQKN